MYVRLTGPSKYVCMYVWGLLSMYVCMSQAAERVCMYICMSETPEHVCMYVSSNWACMYVMCWACMYVSSMYVCLRERRFMYVWMSQTYIHSQARWACMFGMLIFERVCMFKNPVFCRTCCSSNLTQDLKLAFRRHKTGSGISCMSQNLVFCRPLGD